MGISELQRRTPPNQRGTPYRIWKLQQKLWSSEADRKLYIRQLQSEQERLEREQREAAEKRRRGKR